MIKNAKTPATVIKCPADEILCHPPKEEG